MASIASILNVNVLYSRPFTFILEEVTPNLESGVYKSVPVTVNNRSLY